MHGGICEGTILSDGLGLYWPEIGKWIITRIVVVLVSPDIRSEIEDRVVPNGARIRRCDIERAYLRTLVGIAHIAEDRIRASSTADHILHIQIVIRVRRLKPGAAVVQVEMKRVRRRQLAIDAIEDIQLVALGVKDDELRRIEKTSCIQTVHLNKVPPVLAAIAEVHRSGRRPEGAI